MEVGDHVVHCPELKPWIDKEVAFTCEGLHVSLFISTKFKGSDRGCAHCPDSAARRSDLVDLLRCRCGYFHYFPVNNMVADVLCPDRCKGTVADMEHDAGKLHPFGRNFCE